MEIAGNKIIRVILTGPESTGKSDLSLWLAAEYNVNCIKEYAREYIEKLDRPYNYDDVVNIARMQIKQFNAGSEKTSSMLIADTYLIITKIWFVRVFGRSPSWVDSEIRKTKDDLYLLCKPDIPWVQDDVRENGGEMRKVLFNDYKNELIKANLNYAIVEGEGPVRFENAKTVVENYIKTR